MELYTCKNNKLVQLNSILLGIALIMNFIAGTVNDYISINNVFPLGMLILFLVSCLNNLLKKGISLLVSKKMLILVLLFGIQFLFTFIVHEYAIGLYYMQCFLLVGLSSLYLSQNNINVVSVRHTILIVPLICCTHFIVILSKEYTVYTSGDQMGDAYSLLIILFVSLWILVDSKDALKWKIIAFVESLFCLIILTKVMTRGAWLCIFVYVIFLIFKKITNKKIAIFFIILFPLLSIFILTYILPMLAHTEWFSNMFLLKSSEIWNGRESLLENIFTKRGILAVLFGSGIGGYFNNYGIYPHNVIAQLYYDQGLVTLLIIGIIIFTSIKGTISSSIKGNDYDHLIILVFCAGIVKLLLSSYFWIEQLFWIFIGLVICRSKYKMEGKVFYE